jgi:hypothetical protein
MRNNVRNSFAGYSQELCTSFQKSFPKEEDQNASRGMIIILNFISLKSNKNK